MEYQLSFNEIKTEGYERLIEVICEETGLHAFVALHDTTLGPVVGGTRAYPYLTREAAIADVLRLARGMTYKAAFAQTGTGGGKSVIIWDHRKPKPEALLRSFAQAVNSLNGHYICAEDVGMPMEDLAVVGKGTRYAVGLPHPKSSGNPSPFTARGGYLGIQAVCRTLWGSDDVSGKVVAIQGLGSTGWKLAEYLFWEGAQLIVTDIDEKRVEQAVRDFGAQGVEPDEIYSVECDIFAPCALGAILNPQTIPELRCKAVAGVANNQLLTEADGEALLQRGILYAPDYVINSGGLINVCCELEKTGYQASLVRDRLPVIYDFLVKVFAQSLEENLPTSQIANALAEESIARGTGKRSEDLIFHRG